MTKRTYIVTVETDDPDEDLDQAVRQAVAYLSDAVSPAGEYAVTIDVTDHEGNFVTTHYYDPKEEL
jgi:hypothetical protein